MVDSVSVTAGLLCLVVAVVCNGSFATLVKVKRVVECEMQATTFVMFLSFGVALSCWAVIPLYDALDDPDTAFGFTWFGVLGGCLLVLSVTFSILGIEYVGIAMASGTWGGCAIVVSFLWGILVFHNHLNSLWQALAALVLLLSGVVGIAYCEPISSAIRNRGRRGYSDLPTERESLRHRSLSVEDKEALQVPKKNLKMGIVCAMLVGVFGGSILAPAHYAGPAHSGLGFIPSFGIGSVVMGPIVCVVNSLVTGKWPNFKSRRDFVIALCAGSASGIVWNIGNVAALFAIKGLQYTIAYTLVQCALFVGGLWGVFVFNEIRGPAVAVFFVSSFVLIGGAALLAAQA